MRWHGISAEAVGGAAMAALGAFAIIGAQRYGVGTPARMGPGFLPTVLGALLVVFGIAIIIVYRRASGGQDEQKVKLRPLIFVLGATVAFGLLLERVGLFPASVVAVMICCGAEGRYHVGRSAALALVLAAIVSGIFVGLLGVELPVWPS